MSAEDREPATPSPPRDTPITVGEPAPDFRLPAVTTEGEQIEVALGDALAGGDVLLIFYQDDGMPICTSELKAFAQEHETLRKAGVQAYGVNTNGLGSHARFQERDRYPFALISDFPRRRGARLRALGRRCTQVAASTGARRERRRHSLRGAALQSGQPGSLRSVLRGAGTRLGTRPYKWGWPTVNRSPNQTQRGRNA